MGRRRVSKEPERLAISIVLPKDVRDSLDLVADEVQETRSSVLEEMIRYCLEEDHLNELFPYEETGEDEEEEDEEEQKQTADPGVAPKPKKGPGGGLY